MDARTILVTGAASGINAAAAALLRAGGHRVITVVADLATADGRAAMLAQAHELAPEGLDGVVAGAGVTGFGNPALAVRVN